MLRITVEAGDRWDATKQEFRTLDKSVRLVLEHSLISISKWEEKWCQAFLGKEKKTDEQIMDYIRCMIVQPQDPPEEIEYMISVEDQKRINDYISRPATASHINDDAKRLMNRGQKKSDETLTSELIYYYMAEFRLPAEYQKWPLQRLLMLIEICNMKEWEKDPKHKKMLSSNSGSTNLAKAYYEINKRRLEQYHTTG